MIFKSKTILIIFFVVGQSVYSQNQDKPKLIVGIVVDQMRAEYLYRFQDNYTEKGFKRLMKEGFNAKNTHYNYIPTATGPGHASIYTGTTPTNHGIVSNNWYSRQLERSIYCAEDSTVYLVDNLGKQKDKKYKDFSRSAKNLLTTTITDELKLFTNQRSKVIGISLKDRGAIFPAGHMADGAYWYNGSNGNFVTSTYYKTQLPKWLQDFNNQNRADTLLNSIWNTFLPIENYRNSSIDHAGFEKIFKGNAQSTFPYNLRKLRKQNGNYKLLTEVPFGNTLLTELAIAAIKGEHLGKSLETDMISISYSSTDYVGHHFGIRSKEIEDTYVRLDRNIGHLLHTLDKEVGHGNYVLFLTADHAASDHPVFLKANKLPGKFFSSKKIKDTINAHLSKKFGEANYISYMDKTQVYIAETNISKTDVVNQAVEFLKTIEGVKEVFAPNFLAATLNTSTIGNFVKNAYNSKESGDILYHMQSGWMDKRVFGTTHGNAYNYDTHVPMLWYGWKIAKGETIKPKTITQIAPTLSMLLNIPLANASCKIPFVELFIK